MSVPSFYTRLLAEAGLTSDLVKHMRLFVSGSAPLSAETHKAFLMRAGQAILERYGMTETNMNTSNPYDGDRISGTVGMTAVRGPNVFKGYWEQPRMRIFHGRRLFARRPAPAADPLPITRRTWLVERPRFPQNSGAGRVFR